MTTPSSTQVAELVKKCYDSAIRFEGSEPSGLLVAAGDNLLKLQSQKDQLEKERDENQKVLSSVMATSVSNLKERYMDLLERCNKEHLPSKYKSWEEVWNRHVALVKERDQLEKMVLTLREAAVQVIAWYHVESPATHWQDLTAIVRQCEKALADSNK